MWTLSNLLLFFINFVLSVIEILLSLRLLLRLFGANPTNNFVAWIYSTTSGLISPFVGIFVSPVIKGGYVLEMSTLIAMVVYGLIGYLLYELVKFIAYQASSYYEVPDQDPRKRIAKR